MDKSSKHAFEDQEIKINRTKQTLAFYVNGIALCWRGYLPQSQSSQLLQTKMLTDLHQRKQITVALVTTYVDDEPLILCLQTKLRPENKPKHVQKILKYPDISVIVH